MEKLEFAWQRGLHPSTTNCSQVLMGLKELNAWPLDVGFPQKVGRAQCMAICVVLNLKLQVERVHFPP